jgi:hypothetical protein
VSPLKLYGPALRDRVAKACSKTPPLPATSWPSSNTSLFYVMENRASAEIAVVGNEGIVGISMFIGATPLPVARSFRARARLSAARAIFWRNFWKEFNHTGSELRLWLRYIQALLTQMACNRHHTLYSKSRLRQYRSPCDREEQRSRREGFG